MSLFESASLCITPNGTKASKLYAIKPTDGSGDLSVTRATTATRVNSSGLIESVASNVPRLDYTNESCPSILVEPQRTNLFTYSEQFDNIFWTKLNSSVSSNITTSPDGNTTADKIVENTNTSDHAIYQYQNFTSGTTYTVSFYAKKAERTKIRLTSASTSQTPSADFDLNAMTANATASSFNASIVNVGNGWVKCSVSKTSNTTTFDLIYFAMVESFASNSYTGNGTSGLYIWGAQLEAGSYATSYIPTTSASVTRNADVISKTGISSLIGQTEGTVFLDFYFDNLSSQTNDPIILSLGADQYIQIYDDGRIQFYFESGCNIDLTSFGLANGRHKFAFGYKANDFVAYVDGTLAGTDTSGTPNATSFLTLGYSNTNFIGKINYNTVALWKTRLSNSELATLTTI